MFILEIIRLMVKEIVCCIVGASEAAAAAVFIPEPLEEALAGPQSVTSSDAPTGFQAMPPLSTPLHSSTPDVVVTNQTNLLQRFGDQMASLSTPSTVSQPIGLQITTVPLSIPPSSIAGIFAPPTMPAPSPSFPEQVPPVSSSQPVPMSAAGLTQSATGARMAVSFSGLTMPQFTPLIPPLPSGLGAPISTTGPFSNVPSAATYTPISQNIPVVTPMAPRPDRYGSGQQTTGYVLSALAI